MLRRRGRSTQKSQQQMGQIASEGGSETYLQSHLLGQRQKTNPFLDTPGVFVGLSPQSVSDCDSVRSPTSPLDFKLLGNSIRFPKPSQDGKQKCWDCGKVGLGTIMDSLDKDDRNLPGKTIPLPHSKNILFGLQVRSKTPTSLTNAPICEEEAPPKSLPKKYAVFPHGKVTPSILQKGSSDVIFEIGRNPLGSDPFGKIQSFSLDSKRLGSGINKLKTRNAATDINMNVRTDKPCLEIETASFSADNRLMPMSYSEEFARPLTPREIELSEDYTRVISHGRNPKTTHIFGDCVLNCHPNSGNKSERSENEKLVIEMDLPPSHDFLSCCYSCKNKLEDGKDIYMYRGEKAFCSWDCRLEEISIEEEKEKSIRTDRKASVQLDDIFEKSLFELT